MSLMIWAIHSMTVESDQWEHESTDWDVNIWMKSDIMVPLASGFSPGDVRVEQGERRQETSGRAFHCVLYHLSYALWSRPHAPHFLHPHLPFFTHMCTRACTPASMALFLLRTRRFRQALEDPLWWQLGLVVLGRRTSLTVQQNNLWHNSKRCNRRNLH